MDIKDAQLTGSKQVVKTTLFVLLIAELIMLFTETRGDFANGILFFLEEQLDIGFIGLVAILFIASYLLGKSAGKEIIINGRNHRKTGITYALLEILIILVYVIAAYAVRGNIQVFWQFIPSLILELIIFFTIIWLWSVWRIKSKATA
jgi:hypothetical protein